MGGESKARPKLTDPQCYLPGHEEAHRDIVLSCSRLHRKLQSMSPYYSHEWPIGGTLYKARAGRDDAL